jgi:hypothetical protein
VVFGTTMALAAVAGVKRTPTMIEAAKIALRRFMKNPPE